MKKYWELFLTFFKIGAFTFGGGYAMIPIVQREFVENKKMFTDDDMLELLAISESTPGPIAINMATFVGYQTGGVIGAFFATLGVVLPSLIVILILTFFYRKFIALKVVKYAFFGIKAGVLALVLKAFTKIYKTCRKDISAYIIMALAFIAVAFFGISPVIVTLATGIAGIIMAFTLKGVIDK